MQPSSPTTAHLLTCEGRVIDVLEHHRTIRGRRDVSGAVVTDSVNLGWFVHLTINGYGPFAFGGHPTRPTVQVGDTILVTLERVLP